MIKKRVWLIIFIIVMLMLWGCSKISEEAQESIEQTPMTEAVETVVEGTQTVEADSETEDDKVSDAEVEDAQDDSSAYEVDWNNIDTSTIDFMLPDKYFLHYMDDFYDNTEAYLNKVISGEGFILYLDEEGSEFAFCRNYICCGPDAYPVGIVCRYDGEIPKNDTWVTIVGVIGKEKGKFTDTPVLHVISLKKTKEGKNQRTVDY